MPGARQLLILGTRGVPAAHGGFETFAERLALHLVGRGWAVEVACQVDGPDPHPPVWQGVRRMAIRSPGGALGTLLFDLRATIAALRRPGVVLTLGYNTAVLGLLLRLAGRRHAMNMDGIEWQRAKWSWAFRLWFRANERIAGYAARPLIADHPAIADHLARHVPRERIATIPYGADRIEAADPAPLTALGLVPGGYCLVIARPEPENSIREIVAAFSARARGVRLVVLGRFDPAVAYHRAVRKAASGEVVFAGAIYDREVVAALRCHAALYLHGHQVGGTNPSLVEALGAGNAVLAHDNRFNRWVAGPAGAYFSGIEDCDAALGALLGDPARLVAMRAAARARHAADFTWPAVLGAYERLLAG
jgi:glycosyltransferase involved in cell wall biosynthesis